MIELFQNVVDRSASAGWFILALLLLRPILKKAPKWLNPLLWGLVALRLILPFSIHSTFSLVPDQEILDFSISESVSQNGISAAEPATSAAFRDPSVTVISHNTVSLPELYGIACCIWLIGVVIMASYIIISHIRLARRLDTAVLLRGNIYNSDNIYAPFVFGILRPRIYLPFHLHGQAAEYVISHEQTHIARLDHLAKLLGFVLLGLHWFNPLIWIAFAMLCRDIELACDARVIQSLSGEQRADYSQVLLYCNQSKKRLVAYPLAFGEIGVKQRVKSILNYKKPTVLITVTAILLSFLLAGCFLTDPQEKHVLQPDPENNIVAKLSNQCEEDPCTDPTHKHAIEQTQQENPDSLQNTGKTALDTEATNQTEQVTDNAENSTLVLDVNSTSPTNEESLEETQTHPPVEEPPEAQESPAANAEIPPETPAPVEAPVPENTVEEICSPLTCTNPSHGHAAYCTGEGCTDPTHNHKGVCTDTNCTDPEHGHEIAYTDMTHNDAHHSEAAENPVSHHSEYHN